MTVNVIFPVYTEEKRLASGITKTVDFLSNQKNFSFVLTIVDNASTDETQTIAEKLCKEFECVRYIRINEKCVGAAFRAGVAQNQCDIVGYMDVDLSTPLKYISEMMDLFMRDETLQIVNASRLSKKSKMTGRKWYRNITSHGLVLMLKIVLGMKASDAICGFKFFRHECAEKLISKAGAETNSWFYVIELLLRAEREGMNIVELPVEWHDDSKNSTVRTFKLIAEYLSQIFALKKRFASEKNDGEQRLLQQRSADAT